MDLDNYSNINGATLLVIPGHSEYWTKTARQNFDAFVSAGNNALVLSGNTMWWQVRYSNDHTKMICYKSKTADPISDVTLKTYEWIDPSLNYLTETSIGANHLLGGNGLDTGAWANKGWKGYKIINNASPLLRNTNLNNGDIISVPTTEYDGTYLIAATETNNFVQPDPTKLGFKNLEVIGFDYGSYNPYSHVTVPTFIVFQKTVSSGYVVNTCSTDWCSPRGFGGTSAGQIIQITKNGLDYYSAKPSGNAALSSLALSSGTLSPAFASGTNNYTATVSNATTSVTITPVTSDNTATVTVNGTLLTSGSASAGIPLTIGANTITTTVTAQNSFTTNTYTVTVTRPSLNDATLSNLTLSDGTLSPVFSSGTNSYNSSVANTATSITLTPTANNPNATITVNGTVVASGSASASIPLNIGINTITTTVTSQDNSTTDTYTTTVIYTSPSDATLGNLTLSNGTVSPAFSSGTTSYTAGVSNATTSITLTPNTNNGSATVTINGTPVAHGSASAGIALAVGPNIITTIVTAQDGVTTETYITTVTRAPSSVALLSTISLNPSSTLTSVAGPGYANYTASVANNVSSIKVVPTAQDATATIKVNGTTVLSGTASASLPLAVGPNTLTTVVTAQDGVTTETYITTVTRAPSSVALLSFISLNPSSTLTTVSGPGNANYTASVANSVSSIKVVPTALDATATIKVNGTIVSSGTASASIPLAVGPNTLTTVVTAQDGITTLTYIITVTRAASSDATLSSLAMSSGTLNPTFSSATTSYTASVANTVTSITITPTINNATATVKVNGVAVSSGTASAGIPLAFGPNNINAVVTAQDGITITTYIITVTRVPSSVATLRTISLNPSATLTTVSGPGNANYTASVANSVSSIKVVPTALDATATIKVNGTVVPSGTASGSISLAVGPNTLTTVVTAQDGITILTYIITVTRAASSDATLSSLALSSGTISPAFSSGTTSYTASVVNATSVITITPITNNPTATVKVNGAAVSSGTASAGIPLNAGPNTITTIVTAQDGITTITYTVIVTRAPSSNATLANLTVSSGTLSPAFATGTNNYTDAVSNATSVITLTPATSDPNATIKVNGIAVTSGTASGSIALAAGANTINTVVTAQDGVSTRTYSIIVTRAGGPVNNPDQTISVEQTPAISMENDGIMVHQALSPNGDGINDFLVIDGIAAYPENRLTIINRNGALVFEAQGYDNTSKVFDGHSNKTGAMQVPGTYFYALDYSVNGVTKHKTGFIILKY